DTFIRTDSQLITRQPVTFPQNLGIATGESPLARNLNYFDAIFFFGVREIDLTAQQRAALLAFVKEDGKGFVAAHSAITGFFSWPEFGDMIGGRFDEHPWNIVEARVVGASRQNTRGNLWRGASWWTIARFLGPATCRRRSSFRTSTIRSRISREGR